MKIAIISECEERGGAAVALRRLAAGLRDLEPVEIKWFVARRDNVHSDVTCFTEKGRMGRLAGDWFGPIGDAVLKMLNRNRAERNLLRLVKGFKPDVISLHNINQWSGSNLDRSFAAALAEIAPVVWTTHDLWPLTGCVDYPRDLLSWEKGGVAREEREEWVATLIDRIQDRASRDRLFLAGQRLVVVTPSEWYRRLAERVFERRVRVEHIPHGIHLERYRPLDREACRELLDLPREARIVLAVAHSFRPNLKGLDKLVEAVQRLSGVILVLAGEVLEPPRDGNVITLGPICDERLMPAVYSAADVLVHASLAESFGNVVVEAMACGCPCVAFNVGSMAELIQPGITGELAMFGDTSDLAKKIKAVFDLDEKTRNNLATSCRRAAEERYDQRRMAQDYMRLFESLRGSGPSA